MTPTQVAPFVQGSELGVQELRLSGFANDLFSFSRASDWDIARVLADIRIRKMHRRTGGTRRCTTAISLPKCDAPGMCFLDAMTSPSSLQNSRCLSHLSVVHPSWLWISVDFLVTTIRNSGTAIGRMRRKGTSIFEPVNLIPVSSPSVSAPVNGGQSLLLYLGSFWFPRIISPMELLDSRILRLIRPGNVDGYVRCRSSHHDKIIRPPTTCNLEWQQACRSHNLIYRTSEKCVQNKTQIHMLVLFWNTIDINGLCKIIDLRKI